MGMPNERARRMPAAIVFMHGRRAQRRQDHDLGDQVSQGRRSLQQARSRAQIAIGHHPEIEDQGQHLAGKARDQRGEGRPRDPLRELVAAARRPHELKRGARRLREPRPQRSARIEQMRRPREGRWDQLGFARRDHTSQPTWKPPPKRGGS